MESLTFARVIHIVSVVLWIGGVAMVTTVIIPAVKKMKTKEDSITIFEQIEGRFSLQAKVTTLLTGATGFYILYEIKGFDRYLQIEFWWVHAMTLVWFLFMMVLFILEPLLLHKLFKSYVQKNPEKTFNFVEKFHWVLLVLSLITIAGAVAGSHGWFWF